MPLGNVLGEFSAKITSLKQTELSGGQIKIEMNTVGEGTGQLTSHAGTVLLHDFAQRLGVEEVLDTV
jgi:hypothetical protein